MRPAVVVVAWNGEQFLPECLASLLASAPVPDLVVVDNGSRDATPAILAEAGPRFLAAGARFEVDSPGRNLGFTLGANVGLDRALALVPPPGFVVLLNQDAVLAPGAIAAFASTFERHPRAGALGARILFPGGERLQHAGGRLERPRMIGLHLGHHEPASAEPFRQPSEPDFVTGAVMALRSEALAEVGRFDPLFSPGYYEDVDLCVRLREGGWEVRYVPSAEARHRESASFDDRAARFRLSTRNRLLFAAGWLGDDGFRREFEQAELAAIASEVSHETLSALVGGSLEAMLRLPEGVPRRFGAEAARRALGVFGRIRAAALAALCRQPA